MEKTKRFRFIFLRLISLTIILSLCMFIFTGCFNARQLNERALVQAIGIDKSKDGLKLTFQIFSPTSEGGGKVSATAKNANILSSTGKTVSEAIQNATLMQGKELFIGHSRVIVIGKELSEHGVKSALSFFSTDPSSRHNADLAVSKTTAEDILTAKINQGMLPAETLQKILENSKENGLLENMSLYKFLAALENKNESAVLPILELKKEEPKKKEKNTENASNSGPGEEESKEEKIEPISSVSAAGMAVFTDAKMVGELEGETAQGLMWLRNSLEQTTVITQSEDYQLASLHVFKSKSSLTPSYEGDKIKFTLSVNCQATLGEAILREGKSGSIEALPKLQTACESIIIKECTAAFEQAVKGYRADVFNLGNIIWKDNPEFFKTIRDHFPEQLNNMSLTVVPKFIINRTGLNSNA